MPSLEDEFEQLPGRFILAKSVEDALSDVEHRARRRNRRRRYSAKAVGLGLTLGVIGLLVLLLTPRDQGLGTAAGGREQRIFALELLDDGTPIVLSIDSATGASRALMHLEAVQGPAPFPGIAAAPTADLLFVAHPTPSGDQRLEVVAADTGEVIQSYAISSLPRTQLPADPLTSSDDGRLYIYESEVAAPNKTNDWLETYNWQSGEFLPESISLGWCGGAGTVFPLPELKVAILCSVPREVHIVTQDESGAASADVVVALPKPRNGDDASAIPANDPAGAALSEDGSTLYIVTHEGEVFVVDTRAGALKDSITLPLGGENYVAEDGVSFEKGQLTLAVGSVESYDAFLASALTRVDVSTWTVEWSKDLDQLVRGAVLLVDQGVVMLDEDSTSVVLVQVGGDTSSAVSSRLLGGTWFLSVVKG